MKRSRPSHPPKKRPSAPAKSAGQLKKPVVVTKAKPVQKSKPKPSTMSVDNKVKAFGEAMVPLRGTTEFQRISLYVQSRVGSKLQIYLQSEKPESEKIAFLDELLAIIAAKDWDKLPAAPKGQTSEPTPSPAAAPAQTTIAEVAPALEAVSEKEPAVADELPEKLDPLPASAADEDEIIEDPIDKQMAKLTQALKAQRNGGMTEKQVRSIVADEIKKQLPIAIRAVIKEVLASIK